MNLPAVFTLSEPDNGSHFYYPLAPYESPPACNGCGLLTDPEWINPIYRVKRKGLDLSATYDGHTIASDRFLEVAKGIPGIRFLALPASPGFHLVVVDPVVAFDAEARGTSFRSPCEVCGRPTQIAGATPARFRAGVRFPPGFSRTDQVFGSAGDKPTQLKVQHPLIVVDTTTAEILQAEKLIGPHFKPIVPVKHDE